MNRLSRPMGVPSTLALACVLALVACGGCERLQKKLYSPRIKVRCDVLAKACLFINHGDPGEDCVVIEVFHRESGRALRSAPACSGHLERDDPRWIDVVFEESDPLDLCMGDQRQLTFRDHCEVTVIDQEVP